MSCDQPRSEAAGEVPWVFFPLVFKVPVSHWLTSRVLAITDILFLIMCESQGIGTGLS